MSVNKYRSMLCNKPKFARLLGYKLCKGYRVYENHRLTTKASIAKEVFAIVLVASRFTLRGIAKS